MTTEELEHDKHRLYNNKAVSSRRAKYRARKEAKGRYTPEKIPIRQHQLYLVKPRVWRRYLRENDVDPEYRARARSITLVSRLFSPLKFLQDAFFHKKIVQVDLSRSQQVFILGHWRSGTTHLHYLMSKDPQFGFLSNYQALFFNISLLSNARLRFLIKPFFPKRRPQDNVAITPDAPAEEEQPFSTMSARTGLGGFFFPRNPDYFQKYLFFKGISPSEKKVWQRDYTYLLKTITLFNEKKNLVLKNPHNTGRLKELLEMYPDAKFIFIHRNPYDVYQSTLHLYNSVVETQFLQHVTEKELEEIIVACFRDMLKKYIADRKLLSPEQLIEIPFAELERNPMDTVEQIYSQLKLPGFAAAKLPMEEYLKTVEHYRKNQFTPLPSELMDRLNEEWEFFFKEFGYETI
jgi:omega-hydroxy-beta-dihydromenaquinone-9 sulfotransferase